MLSAEDHKLRIITICVIVGIAITTIVAVVLGLNSLDVMESTSKGLHKVALTPSEQPTIDPFGDSPEELMTNADVLPLRDVMDDSVDEKWLNNVMVTFRHAAKLRSANKYEEALTIYRPITASLAKEFLRPSKKSKPASLASYFRWGHEDMSDCYVQLHRYDEALVELNEVLKYLPEAIPTLNRRAKVYEKLGQPQLAHQDRVRIAKIQAQGPNLALPAEPAITR